MSYVVDDRPQPGAPRTEAALARDGRVEWGAAVARVLRISEERLYREPREVIEDVWALLRAAAS